MGLKIEERVFRFLSIHHDLIIIIIPLLYGTISSRSQRCCQLLLCCQQEIVTVTLFQPERVLVNVHYLSAINYIFLITTTQCTQVNKAMETKNLPQGHRHIDLSMVWTHSLVILSPEHLPTHRYTREIQNLHIFYPSMGLKLGAFVFFPY